jgi:hypothetical protein
LAFAVGGRLLSKHRCCPFVIKNDPILDQKSLAKWMRTQDKSMLESAYRSYAPRISLPPYTNLTEVQVVVVDLATSRSDAKERKAQEFVNEEVLRELDQQGFFKSLQNK